MHVRTTKITIRVKGLPVVIAKDHAKVGKFCYVRYCRIFYRSTKTVTQKDEKEQEQKKKEQRKKSKNKYPGKRKGKNETTTSQEDAKRLKKLEKDERQLDLIRSAIRQKGEKKL